MSRKQPVLALQHINKSFGSKQVLYDVSLEVHRGEIYGFLGPNGAGKSTTIRVLLGALYAESGNITLFGSSDYTSPQLHARIGYLAGDMAMDEDLTGEQYLGFIAGQYRKDCRAAIARLSKLLQADVTKKIGQYSRGNRQKIGLIAALMHDPELLILDEPTSGFDPLIQEEFLQLMRAFRDKGGTVFMSSHILSEVQHLCDRVAFIKEGRIVAIRTVADLETSATKQLRVVADAAVAKRVLAGAKGVGGLQLTHAQAGVITGTYTGQPKALLAFLAAYNTRDVTITESDLDSVFMTYYEGEDVNHA